MTTTSNPHPYGLGRLPSIPDARNWSIRSESLSLVRPTATADPALDAALEAFLRKHYSKEAKLLATLLVQRIEAVTPPQPAPGPTPVPPGPGPTPPPPPAPSAGWPLGAPGVLDQGQTPHCVGFTGADFLNLDPVEDHVANDIGNVIYFECKVIDGEPKQEDGSSIHSLAKALQNRKRIANYAWLADLAAARTFVRTNGPVPIGIDWYNDMFNPDSRGLVTPTGGVAGGHAITIVDDDVVRDEAVILNHWGTSWGVEGYFRMAWVDLGKLLFNSNGEALATLEVAL